MKWTPNQHWQCKSPHQAEQHRHPVKHTLKTDSSCIIKTHNQDKQLTIVHKTSNLPLYCHIQFSTVDITQIYPTKPEAMQNITNFHESQTKHKHLNMSKHSTPYRHIAHGAQLYPANQDQLPIAIEAHQLKVKVQLSRGTCRSYTGHSSFGQAAQTHAIHIIQSSGQSTASSNSNVTSRHTHLQTKA